MAAPKGTRPPAAGIGRKKGVPNKTTALLKEQLLGALAANGGQAYFSKLAKTKPEVFCSLLGRIIPTQITGEGGGPVMLITGVPRAED